MEKKLTRNVHDKMLAGVCSGLADYFGIDVTLVRVAFIVAVLAGLSGVLAYIILWVVVPSGKSRNIYNDRSRFYTDYTVYEEKTHRSSHS
jgi:phage shock protein C